MIGAFWDPVFGLTPSAEASDLSKLKILKNAGFNLLTGANESPLHWPENRQKLELVAKIPGLQMLNCDWRWWDAKIRPYDSVLVGKILNQYGKTGDSSLTELQRNVFLGYFLSDEPLQLEFTPGTNEPQVENVLKWRDALMRGDSSRLTLVNLNPYVKQQNYFRDTNEYKIYLDNFLRDSKVKVISYDYYAFMINGSWNKYYAEETYYWRNLGWLARRVKQTGHGQSFWAFVMSSEHNYYEAATSVNLRLTAYAPLLYGARGLLYFTYGPPRVDGVLDKNYRSSIVDSVGLPFEPNYSYVKAINRKVSAMGPYLMSLDWMATIHGGKPSKKAGIKDPESGEPHLPGLKQLPSTDVILGRNHPSLPSNCALGVFRHQVTGLTYLLIMNKSRHAGLTPRIQVKGKKTGYRFNPENEKWERIDSEYDTDLGATHIRLSRMEKAEIEMIRIEP